MKQAGPIATAACAEVYKARKAEYDRELKKLAGIKTIEVDI